MKRNYVGSRHPRGRWLPVSEAGFSLIELMVSLVVGMLVVLAAVQLFASNRGGATAVDDAARIQEGVRSSLDVLSRHLRMAGYHPVDSTANFPDASNACTNSELQAICGFNPDDGTYPNKSDEVRIRFWGASAPAGAADGETMDCTGAALSDVDVVEERFRVQNINKNPNDATTSTPTLVCAVVRGAAAIRNGGPETVVPLVFGVDTFQILYGEDTDSSKIMDRWRAANSVANFSNVKALQVGLVFRGDGQAGGVRIADYKLFGEQYLSSTDTGATYTVPQDGRQRRSALFSVDLRNRSN